jgi:hypothetical protein
MDSLELRPPVMPRHLTSLTNLDACYVKSGAQAVEERVRISSNVMQLWQMFDSYAMALNVHIACVNIIQEASFNSIFRDAEHAVELCKLDGFRVRFRRALDQLSNNMSNVPMMVWSRHYRLRALSCQLERRSTLIQSTLNSLICGSNFFDRRLMFLSSSRRWKMPLRAFLYHGPDVSRHFVLFVTVLVRNLS